MDLRNLRYFLTVADELHFGRAAKRLHISQPPLSRQIQKLEGELGVTLLQRTQRRVELTEAGKTFRDMVISALDGIDRAVEAARRSQQGKVGKFAIGFFRGAIYRILPAILERFREAAPDVELDLREMEMPEVPLALLAESINIGFVRPPVANAALLTAVLSREDLLLALPEGHRLCGRKNVRLSELSSENFVMYGPGPSVLGNQVMSACYRAGFTPRIVQHVRHPETVLGLVRSGVGVGVVSSSSQEHGGPGLGFIRVSGLPQARIVAVWRRDDRSPLLVAFLKAARDIEEARKL